MRIGIDCRTILNPAGGELAGIGHYTYYLVKNLLAQDKKNTYVLFFDFRMKDIKEFEQKNVEIVYFPFSQYKKFLPFAYSHVLAAAEIKSRNVDVYHAPANVIPMNYSRPSVLTIHDMAIYKHPEWFPGGQNFSIKTLVPSSIKKASRIIAVSQSTKKDIVQLMKVPAGNIDVVYEAGNQEKIPSEKDSAGIIKKYKINKNFVLYLGTLEIRKNIDRLIKAWEKVCESKPKKFAEWQLVIAGQKGFGFAENFNAIKSSKVGHKIRYIGYVPADDKNKLMKTASIFAFPSLYEGFGLPVIEAMAMGTPVLTSNVSSLPEVVGDSAVMVNPQKVEDIAKKLENMIGNKRLLYKIVQKGKLQIKKFSWKECAKKTLAVYDKVYKQTHK